MAKKYLAPIIILLFFLLNLSPASSKGFFKSPRNVDNNINQQKTLLTKPKTPISINPSILSIHPKSAILEVGGNPVSLNVEGKFLEKISSVQVIKDGRVVPEIKAELVRPWPSSNKIELQSGPRVRVGKGYRLRASALVNAQMFNIDVPEEIFILEVVVRLRIAQKSLEVLPRLPSLQRAVTYPLILTIWNRTLRPIEDIRVHDTLESYMSAPNLLTNPLPNEERFPVNFKSGQYVTVMYRNIDIGQLIAYTTGIGLDVPTNGYVLVAFQQSFRLLPPENGSGLFGTSPQRNKP